MEWTSIEVNEPPENVGVILAFDHQGQTVVDVGYRDGGAYFADARGYGMRIVDAKQWQPLPEPPTDCRVGLRPAGPDDQAVYQAIANNFWLARPNCLTCANRGELDGLSQETHCSHCVYQEKWRTSHYAPNAQGKPTAANEPNEGEND